MSGRDLPEPSRYVAWRFAGGGEQWMPTFRIVASFEEGRTPGPAPEPFEARSAPEGVDSLRLEASPAPGGDSTWYEVASWKHVPGDHFQVSFRTDPLSDPITLTCYASADGSAEEGQSDKRDEAARLFLVVGPAGRSTTFSASDLLPNGNVRVETFVADEDGSRRSVSDWLEERLEGADIVLGIGLGVHTTRLSRHLPDAKDLVVSLDDVEIERVVCALHSAAEEGAGDEAFLWSRVDLLLVPTEEARDAIEKAFEEAGVPGPREVRPESRSTGAV